jgi:hypothetical protein
MIAETEIRLPPEDCADTVGLTARLARRLGVAPTAITHHVVVRRWTPAANAGLRPARPRLDRRAVPS